MKRFLALMFAAVLSFALVVCGGGNESKIPENTTGGSEDTADNSEQPTTDAPTAAHAETRSDPYEFDDEVTIVSKSRSGDYAIEYTIEFICWYALPRIEP